MIANINDSPIVLYVEIPSKYKGFINYHLFNSDIHYTDGWRYENKPAINQEVEKLGEVYFDESTDVFTYPIIQKTIEEIKVDALQKLNQVKSNKIDSLIRVNAITIAQTIEDRNEIAKQAEVFPFWEADGSLAYAGEKYNYFNLDGTISIYICSTNDPQGILKTVQYNPIDAHYAYRKLMYKDGYMIWQQPFADNPYMIGEIVWYEDELWISTVDGNTHAPKIVSGAWINYEE